MVNSRFSVAIHILSLIATTSDKSLLTSDFIGWKCEYQSSSRKKNDWCAKKAGLLSSHSGMVAMSY